MPRRPGTARSHLSGRHQPNDHDLARLRDLTEREVDVLRLIRDGLSNAEIADRLVVGLHTVKTHVSPVLTKTGCQSRAQSGGAGQEHPVLTRPRSEGGAAGCCTPRGHSLE
ncbi:hypothetical protein ACE1SV_62700 [Streptomyces sennicomposti]